MSEADPAAVAVEFGVDAGLEALFDRHPFTVEQRQDIERLARVLWGQYVELAKAHQLVGSEAERVAAGLAARTIDDARLGWRGTV